MLNEERVILMTRMASYEEGEGRKDTEIARYFRSDYVAIQILKAFLCGSLSFLLVVGLYIYYNFESFIEDVYEIDLMSFAQGILKRYIWFIAIYLVITYAVCTIRFVLSHRNLQKFYGNLKKLSKLYKKKDE